MQIKIGEKIKPTPPKRENDADNVWGPGWHAKRGETNFRLSYQVATHGGGDREIPISRDEFDKLRSDAGQFDAVLRAHGE